MYYKTGEFKGQEKRREWVDKEYYPTFEERVDAAKAAAPYFAPRLSGQAPPVNSTGPGDEGPESGVMLVPSISADDWKRTAEKSQATLKENVKS